MASRCLEDENEEKRPEKEEIDGDVDNDDDDDNDEKEDCGDCIASSLAMAIPFVAVAVLLSLPLAAEGG